MRFFLAKLVSKVSFIWKHNSAEFKVAYFWDNSAYVEATDRGKTMMMYITPEYMGKITKWLNTMYAEERTHGNNKAQKPKYTKEGDNLLRLSKSIPVPGTTQGPDGDPTKPAG